MQKLLYHAYMDYTGYKRGYLHDEYRLFHVKDKTDMEFSYHYHEFDKIVVFLTGNVTYIIEGTAYYLRPWDILLVGREQVHCTQIDGKTPYERVVLWLSPGMLEKQGGEEPLCDCMRRAKQNNYALVRPEGASLAELMRLLQDVEAALASREYAHALLAKTSLLQFLILLNRVARQMKSDPSAYHRDHKVTNVLEYIANHLDGDLSVEGLAARFYLSPSHFAHRFKTATGYSPHAYVTQKRLLHAAELIKAGTAAGEAAASCGFEDYSTFLRAFKRMLGCKPSELLLPGRE
ncbi:MAG: AraC family transcriptional regulator [Eubacteriales bacterium]|nr:AraC family transcriptional regulator [Eubacteriales bacterium]